MPKATLGVVVVTFNSADVILDCLESLLAATGVALRVVIVDNASTDGTVGLLRDWAAGRQIYRASDDIPFPLAPCAKPLPLAAEGTASVPVSSVPVSSVPVSSVPASNPAAHHLTLIETGVNGGFAFGVNRGLACLARMPEVDRFWVLNPDSVVPAHTPAAFATMAAPAGGFALIGGRVLYLDHPDTIQIDGGTLNARTGITGNLNLFAKAAITQPPDPAAMRFITGASLVASRAFYDAAGPMPEDYFLYYEEVDWALRRGPLPLAYCAEAVVYHRAGTAIGSAAIGRPASPFSLYFKHRARLRFMRRYFPRALPVAYAYSLAKAVQLLVKGYPTEAWTVFSASLGLPPSRAIRARLSPAAARLAFAPQKRLVERG